jgi:drug/metabolite transporter (DMT)-like permease
VDKKGNTLLGILMAIAIWVTAGFALPFVKVLELKGISYPQLLLLRGYVTALIVLVLVRGKVATTDRYTWWIALTVPFASYGLFRGIVEWEAGPTLIVIAATPAINFLVTVFQHRKVSLPAVLSFLLVMGGIMLALWKGAFTWSGFTWSVIGLLCNGLLYEWFSRSDETPLVNCFWGSVGIGTIGFVTSILTGRLTHWEPMQRDVRLLGLALVVVLVGGLLYWLANLLTFRNLQKDSASVLAQGETPAVVLVAAFVLHEQLTVQKVTGITIALLGASYLLIWLVKQSASQVKS